MRSGREKIIWISSLMIFFLVLSSSMNAFAQPYAYANGDTCLNYMLPGNPDEYLEGSGNPTDDWWAVVFHNPGGAAMITSISFRFFDGGVIDLHVFTCDDLVPEDGLCESGLLFSVPDLLDVSLTPAIRHAFLGTGLHPEFNWEHVDVEDSCIVIGPKDCFIVAWQKVADETPRIMADDTEGAGTHSWIWNDELGEWKCFPNLEFCVDVCLDYLRQAGIQWSAHPAQKAVELEFDRLWRKLGDRRIGGNRKKGSCDM